MEIFTDRQFEALKALKERLNSFSIIREFSVYIFVVLLLIVGAILAIALGEILFIILIVGGGLLAEFVGLKIIDTKPHRKDIAYEICALMDECLAEDIENSRKVGQVILSTVSIYENNRSLYKRFISRFPEMKSFKLWYISGYKNPI